MSNNDELKGMLMTFRVSELQTLLGFASQNRTGRKTELQARAISLLRTKSVPHLTSIQAKIRELYKTAQEGGTTGSWTAAAAMNTQRAMPMLPPAHPPQTHQTTPATNIAPPPNHPTPPPSPYMSMQNRQMGTMYAYTQKMTPTAPVQQAPAPVSSGFPVHPEVRLKHLPFFDVLGEIIKPSSLIPPSARTHEASFVFYLTPQQATEIASGREVGPGTKNEYLIQVQLRFCLLETTTEQDDIFPPGICVKVNGKLAQLPNPVPTTRPGAEPKRPPRPVNISPLVKLSPCVSNHISVSWTPEYNGRNYVLVVYLVRKLSATDLLNRLKNKGARLAEFTTGLIKEKLAEDGDCDIATTSLRVSLMCPLARTKMSIPCRSTMCSHLQCFEASSFLQMNEKRPTWSCPVCNNPILYDTLVIDGYFQDVLTSPKVTHEIQEIQLHKDGTWSVSKADVDDPKPANKVSSSTDVQVEEILDDEESGKPTKMEADSGTGVEKAANAVTVDLTESDDEASPAPAPPVKQDNFVSDSTSVAAKPSEGATHIISLDSPSPPPHNGVMTGDVPRAGDLPPPPPYDNMYPQVVPSHRPLIMQIRMPRDHGRYHPF